MNHTTETSQKFLTEAALILHQNGYQAEHLPDGQLEVFYDEQRLCRVRPNAGIIYRSEDITSSERLDAKDTVCEIVQAVSEYVRQMERAPALKIKGIEDFRILADFNGTLLAAKESSLGVQFVTWDWDFDHKGVSHGHYFTNDYAGAKQDFTVRSCLIPRCALFDEDQMTTIYRCCTDALDYGLDMTVAEEQRIKGIQEQIEQYLPDIAQSLKEHSLLPSDLQEQTL
ncbi:MAG: hypothetical protein IJ955_10365 [Oscillospiraceae bacterium]|nr:hypothetical protein [Oscillospiraceae bacterium]